MAEETIFGFNKHNVIVAAGLAGAAFVGYCIYFDHKRRSDPEYKNKIRQKRREREAGSGRSHMGTQHGGVPSPADPAGMQAFFLQEVQLGEELMAQGNIDEGAEHIANAVVLCGQSQQLLTIFQQTLPGEQFNAVIEKLPSTRERLSQLFGSNVLGGDENFGSSESSVEIVGNDAVQVQELIDDELE